MAGRPLSYLVSVPVDAVKGIGPRTAKKLGDVGVHSVADLLLHVPRRYLDRSQLFNIAAVPLGEEVTIGGTVMSVRRRRIRGNRTMIDARITDGTSVVEGVWFNPYLRLEEGTEVALSGKVELFRGKLQMKSPDVDRLDGSGESLITGRVVPVHPSLAGLSSRQVRVSVHNALRRSQPVTEVLPEDLLDRLDLLDRSAALAAIHFPEEMVEVAPARKRLVFDELFRLEVALALRKRRQIEEAAGVAHQLDGGLVAEFVGALPYTLTGAQQRAIDEIRTDMASPHPMHRLLQGEVGSGKTVVAFAALLTGVQGGFQGAVMAPTEVLAEQHYLGMEALVEEAGLAPEQVDGAAASGQDSLFAPAAGEGPVVRMALLTSNSAVVNFAVPGTYGRSDVVSWVGDGTADLVVGTHALIQEGLHFSRLGIAVVDEQHRFGVYQRVSLREKAADYDPDLLIMTATPIPRTLSMTLYGDLDVSVLDEMPPGRTPVVTRLVSKSSRDLEGVYDLIRSQVAEGRQAFVVCPLVEDSDKLEAASATAEHVRLKGVLPSLRLGLLHGQLRPDEKDRVMHQFRDRELDVLVATTVIEVGIDIPNATVMIIEDADRFGLSQLHQLRGRVGRGEHASTCVLVAEPTTDDGAQRLAAMVETTDGFRLAEEDLRIRGQGTVFGTKQAGVKDLKLADILRDTDLLVAARREAFAIVAADPDLDQHAEIREEVRALLGSDVEWLLRS
ncbi:MAG TPA: ATP-dependent DNA helicase RecG [Acidimicrobiia bacterium]|jgi:ATP-dependent DNA helicase RecG|nr:ATP-dependent DNA helicase RecG [Acidimicrobiia bacterium]